MAPPPPDPLEVNDTLRSACAGYASDDDLIRTILIFTNNGEAEGRSKSESLMSVMNGCSPTSNVTLQISCVACGTAAVEQVYSR